MQILIIGMHRSGTSCLSRLLNMMGAYFSPEGTQLEAQPDNPKGFWERPDVVHLNDKILNEAGGTWDQLGKFNLQNISKDKKQLLKNRIQSTILGLDSHRPWCLKDPRMCLTLPYWQPFLEIPTYIFIFRNPLQVGQSLLARNNIPLHIGIALWEYYTVSALNHIRGKSIIFIRYENIMADPIVEIKKLFDQLQHFDVTGLKIPTNKEISSFICTDLFHMKAKDEELSSYLEYNQLELFNLVANNPSSFSDISKPLKVSKKSIEILEQFSTLDKETKKNQLLESKIEECKEKFNEKSDELATTRENLSLFQKELDEKTNTQNKLQKKYSQEQEEKKNLCLSYTDIKKKYQNTTYDISTLKQKYSKIEGQLTSIKSINRQLFSKIESLRESRQELLNKLVSFPI